jgi:hypothetical protein
MSTSWMSTPTPDASSTVKGKIQLAGDLSGTAASPQIASGAVGSPELAAGAVVQVVNAQFSAVATGTTTMPFDDTIPQSSEGDQYMTLAITPKSATNILVIHVSAMLANSAGAGNPMSMALFQDSTANALAANASILVNTNVPAPPITLTYSMTAGTTSSTTFKVRAGLNAGSTTTFNGYNTGRLFGAIPKSSMIVWEYKA